MGFREFLRNLFAAPERPEPVPDKGALEAEVRRLAAVVDDYIDDVSSPRVLEEKPEFEAAVEILADPVFTDAELLEMSPNPPDAIWQMGLAAVARRDPESELVKPLLDLFEEGYPWHKYFAMNALAVHTPLDRSLAGEVLVRLTAYGKPQLDFLFKITAPVLRKRVENGEKPAFGALLEKLDGDDAESLEDVLKFAANSALEEIAKPLRDEFQTWRGSFVDRSVLEEIGRIHDGGGIGRPLVLSHPLLEGAATDILRSLDQDPRRSVLVTGEHGVGKSAVIHEVAAKLADRGWLIFEASSANLIAGQSYIGEFEARMRDLVAQLGGGRRVLWYIPEFQTLSWVGKTTQSKSGGLDLVLPHLESGNIVIVGELTATAYQQLVQNAPRLLSACEVCSVPPLDEEGTLDLAGKWAQASQPEEGPELVSEPVLQEAWLLARQYLRDRESPGCLLDFLEQTRRILAVDAKGPVTIGRDDLIKTLSVMTGLPWHILDERETLDPGRLKGFFESRILGQTEAVSCLIDRISLIKAGLTDPSRPQGVFLFAGPTGTGKTEIAKALATFLFGSPDRLLRCDMSEFQTTDSLERLVGDGHNLDRESLALKVRKQPFSVVLLDEFEKAHPKVWDLFLQVFDDGRLTDPLGRTSDFRHTIIILTSNLGGQAATGAGLGFDQDGREFRATEVGRAVGKVFRPEFLNRLDRTVVFRPFTREVMRELLEKELRDVQERRGLRNRSWAVVWEDSALEFLLDRGFSATLGARPLKRAVERYLLTPLADIIVKGDYPAGDQFLYIQTRGDGLAVDFIDPEVDEEPDEETPGSLDDDACARSVADEPACLAAIALNPAGTPAELEGLRRAWQELRDHLDSPAWRDAKTLALSMTSVPGFWSSPERFTVLGEVEYRERIETGLETVGNLLDRIAPPGGGERDRYPRNLLGQAADRLGLLDRARQAVEARSPWEAFVLIEDKQGPNKRVGTDWAGTLSDMYQAWGRRRKMRVQVLQAPPPGTTRNRSILLGVSGYAAYDILVPENGLHVREEPDPNRPSATVQHKALVRVVSQPEDRVADGDSALLAMGLQAFEEGVPGAPVIVRTYREKPDPLVKDRVKGWRSGRLARVLGGDFDLLGACADHRAGGGKR